LTKSATFSLPESVLQLIDEVRLKRRDPTRSDTVRVLLLQALAAMSYLPRSEKKALGIVSRIQSRGLADGQSAGCPSRRQGRGRDTNNSHEGGM
jgi:metal-responsive CopG/Arc/MetJ family transcriptional regulator